jgi:hypothetical protein
MLEAIEYIGRVEVIDPMEILLFAVVPGAIGPLIVGCVSEGLPRQVKE